MYTIGQLAKQTGITVRTLHYYDEKGLLPPAHKDAHGHRFYDNDSIVMLQQITMYKYLGYTLRQIEGLLAQQRPIIDVLAEQRTALLEKRMQLDHMLATIDTAIVIQQKSPVVNAASLLVVMQSMLTVNEQKTFLRTYLPEELIANMYDYFEQNIVSINARYLSLTHALQEAYVTPLPDAALKALLRDYFTIIPTELAQQIAVYMQDVDDAALDNWLFTSLLSDEEEAWLLACVEKFDLQKELFV